MIDLEKGNRQQHANLIQLKRNTASNHEGIVGVEVTIVVRFVNDFAIEDVTTLKPHAHARVATPLQTGSDADIIQINPVAAGEAHAVV